MPGAFLHFGTRAAIGDLPPPEIGEHSMAVLREIGTDQADIDRLMELGVVRDGLAQKAMGRAARAAQNG